MGFEYFYGFVGGDASRWRPNLLRKEQDIAQETKRVLMVAAVAEAVTGLALLLVPSIVAQVLLGRNLSAPP